MKNRPASSRVRPQFEELEPRILYSADAGALLNPDALTPSAEVRMLDLTSTASNTNSTQTTTAKTQIIFVDTQISDYQQLLDDILASQKDLSKIEVVELDATQDGITQISELLKNRNDIQTVHIVSHGLNGALELGSAWLNTNTLETRADEIAQWGNALSTDADILLYGCAIATNADGKAFADRLASLTGADIAASDDRTGAASLGGDWLLEYQIGTIESQALFYNYSSQTWQGLLALNWNTFLGGSIDEGKSTVVDASGNVYVIGNSSGSWGSPAPVVANKGDDVFVAKLNSSGVLQWHTFLGSTSTDTAGQLSIDSSGNLIVSGVSLNTWGTPVRAFTAGNYEAFVAKVDGTTGALMWNTFLGGAGYDGAISIDVDSTGNIYVTGESASIWGTPVQTNPGIGNAFAAKLNTSGALVWNTFFNSTGTTNSKDIKADVAGNVYIAMTSDSSWGTTSIDPYSAGDDATIVKLNSSGVFQWNSFFGGIGAETVSGLVLDASNNIYLTGTSAATWGTPVNSYTSGTIPFAAKINSSGALVWNTFFANISSSSSDIAISGTNLYITGSSGSTWGNPWNPFRQPLIFTLLNLMQIQVDSSPMLFLVVVAMILAMELP